jgi:hypothetical protein
MGFNHLKVRTVKTDNRDNRRLGGGIDTEDGLHTIFGGLSA